MDQQTERFIDRMATNLATDGYPRVAGLVYGLLLLSPDGLSLDDLADRLAVSKASVSTNGRLLAQRGIVERFHLPGDRRDYYRVYPDHFERTMTLRLEKLQRVTDALREARTGPGARHPAVVERLRLYEARYGELSAAIRGLLEQWAERPSRVLAGAGR